MPETQGAVLLQKQDLPKPPTIKYSSMQIESARTYLEVFTKHSREYMVRHGEWKMCMHTPTQLVLPSQLLSDSQCMDLLRVPITQLMVDLLCTIFDRTDNLNGSMANQLVRMWLAQYEQFGSFQTTMNEADRDVSHH